jgi:eukaryotic-like serine/threonine-protein kinase
MERTLAAFARSDAPLAARLAVVRELARAVAELHARGRTQGTLRPERVLVLSSGAVLLARPAAGSGALAGAGYEAPEVARGARSSRRADAFSLGALAYLALAGQGPFAAEEPLERVRRVLFEEPEPLRRLAPDVPAGVDDAIAALLEKRPGRRAGAGALLQAIAAADATAVRPERDAPDSTTAVLPRHGPPDSTTAVRPERSGAEAPRSRRAPSLAAHAPAAAAHFRRAAARIARIPAIASLSPLRRAGLAALPILALALVLGPADAEIPLEREIAALVEQGDLAGARGRLELAAKERPGDPIVEKLRGDVACARGSPAECVRRYRVALAARPELRQDPALRRNARRLLAREQPCATRRSAAHLLGELRDPEALPSLEAARRSGGIFAFLCTGDSIDRAITATRAELRRAAR